MSDGDHRRAARDRWYRSSRRNGLLDAPLTNKPAKFVTVIRVLFLNLIAPLLLESCVPFPPTCNPYAPDGGLFGRSAFNRVLATPIQSSST